ncbi:MAG: hypothetical protein L3J37_00220 [Rhodobacteraceae bacterium]|nr:hypothetical protein [Paracoccaceae bacterium]
MTDINTFIKKIGRSEIAALGLREQEISRAKREGVFPSGWYLSIKDLAERKGVELSPYIFKWSRKAPVPCAHPAVRAGAH